MFNKFALKFNRNLNLSTIIVLIYVGFYLIGGTSQLLDPLNATSKPWEDVYLVTRAKECIFLLYLLYKGHTGSPIYFKIVWVVILLNLLFHLLSFVNYYNGNFVKFSKHKLNGIFVSNTVISIFFIFILVLNRDCIE